MGNIIDTRHIFSTLHFVKTKPCLFHGSTVQHSNGGRTPKRYFEEWGWVENGEVVIVRLTLPQSLLGMTSISRVVALGCCKGGIKGQRSCFCGLVKYFCKDPLCCNIYIAHPFLTLKDQRASPQEQRMVAGPSAAASAASSATANSIKQPKPLLNSKRLWSAEAFVCYRLE